jgi:phage terminase Nu1 subunit (DNA packaging protein)
MTEKETISAAALAELLRLTPARIRQLAEDGVMVRTGHGKYDLELSVGNYVERLREQAAGRATSNGSGLNLPNESALLKRAQREYYELKNALTKGDIVKVSDIAPAWARVVLAVRAAMLAIPGRARLALVLSAEQAEAQKVNLRCVAHRGSHRRGATNRHHGVDPQYFGDRAHVPSRPPRALCAWRR